MEAPLANEFDYFFLCIREPGLREAMSSSVALKRPERRFGGTIASSASNFTDGSARV
ncbi:hypothetical protein OOOCML_32515 (plasmid) [Cupriavidus necator H16]